MIKIMNKMKKVITILAAAAMICACGNTPVVKTIAELESANEALVQQWKDAQKAIQEDATLDDEAKNAKMEAEYERISGEFCEYNKSVVLSKAADSIKVAAFQNISYMLEQDELSALIEKLPEELKAEESVAAVIKSLNAKIATAEGQKFVDFTVEHVYGFDRSMDPKPLKKEVKFSDYVGNGKYVLVDFWSPWCGPCWREIPKIKAVYEKYRGENLNVLGIEVWGRQSVQVTMDKAAELGIDWDQINNAQSIPTEIYGIEGIPHLMLIGPDGTILKRGLRGAQIEEEVAKYVQPNE